MLRMDQKSNTGMVGGGDKYILCSAGASTLVKSTGGRIVRIIPLTGTGTVQVNDNNVPDTSGQTIWPATAQVLGAAGIILLDCPTTNGISVTVGATTTCLAVYT